MTFQNGCSRFAAALEPASTLVSIVCLHRRFGSSGCLRRRKNLSSLRHFLPINRQDVAAKFGVAARNPFYLMFGIFKNCRPGKFFWCTVIVFFALQKMQGDPYLALIGPPPLRFEVIAPNNPLFEKGLALPMPKDDSIPTAVFPMNTPAAPVQSLSNGVSSTKSPKVFLSDAAKNAKSQANPANNLLSTEPQMINQYLQPDRNAAGDANSYQPGDTIFVPAELGFLPPMPVENRAIYQSR